MSGLPKDIALLRTAPVRMLTKCILSVSTYFSRLYSKVYGATLFPEARNLACHWTVEVKYPERIVLGNGVIIGKSVTLGALGGIKLGDNVRISKYAILETATLDYTMTPPYQHKAAKITIGNNVWIGTSSIILAGVTIGDDSIIGAGTVVTRDVPARTVVVGQKPRIIARAH